jgi:hypothetical protein
MGRFYRENAEIGEKIYFAILTIIFIISAVGTCYAIFFAQFKLRDIFGEPVTATAISAIILLIPVFFDRNPITVNQIYSKGIYRRILFYFQCYFVLFVMTSGFFTYFLPYTYTNYYGIPFETHTKITRKTDTYRRHECDLRIYLDSVKFRYDGDSDICVTQDFYNSVNVGDVILIDGIESKYGISITGVSKKPR